MNATLFDYRLKPSRSALQPTPGENINVAWATRIALQIVRAAGYTGSVKASPVYGREHTWEGGTASIPETITVRASATIPPGVFGTVLPPAIWAFAQYGSVVVYKNFSDFQRRFYTGVGLGGIPGGEPPPPDPIIPYYRTWIENLRVTTITAGGTWTFDIVHRFGIASPYAFWGDGNPAFPEKYWTDPGLCMQWMPIDSARSRILEELRDYKEARKQVTLHWIALGADPNETREGLI